MSAIVVYLALNIAPSAHLLPPLPASSTIALPLPENEEDSGYVPPLTDPLIAPIRCCDVRCLVQHACAFLRWKLVPALYSGHLHNRLIDALIGLQRAQIYPLQTSS